ncbi:MAG TPA: MarR family winged helix-turn-helix transcriptional regulator [Bacteroidia bacterium]|nr:MarR family winged helix-turn-helix transcriptional regulator [Bacteroidia bacterium]
MAIIDDLGPLAVAARLQRLADIIRSDGAIVYQAHDIDFHPKWFPVVYVLHKKGPTSVVDLAAEVGIAHPSVIQLVKELEAKKLVKSSSDKTDGRRRLLSLTPAAVKLIKEMEPVWEKIRTAVTGLVDTENNLMKAMEETEERLKTETFYHRVMRQPFK